MDIQELHDSYADEEWFLAILEEAERELYSLPPVRPEPEGLAL